MAEPTPGYDDPTVIPKQLLLQVVQRFENELGAIQASIHAHALDVDMRHIFEEDFWVLRHSAEEIGVEHAECVEHLIETYQRFREHPDQERLDLLIADMECLKSLLPA